MPGLSLFSFSKELQKIRVLEVWTLTNGKKEFQIYK